MLNKQQIQLVQIAVKAAGLRTKTSEGRYRLLLGQYKQPGGASVTSCKQLNNWQLEDILGICESMGWQCPGKEPDHFRNKAKRLGEYASFAQQSAIGHLAGDLGWNGAQLNGLIRKLAKDDSRTVANITPKQAYGIIEALKAILSRETGKQYHNLEQIKEEMEQTRDGKEQTCQV